MLRVQNKHIEQAHAIYNPLRIPYTPTLRPLEVPLRFICGCKTCQSELLRRERLPLSFTSIHIDHPDQRYRSSYQHSKEPKRHPDVVVLVCDHTNNRRTENARAFVGNGVKGIEGGFRSRWHYFLLASVEFPELQQHTELSKHTPTISTDPAQHKAIDRAQEVHFPRARKTTNTRALHRRNES